MKQHASVRRLLIYRTGSLGDTVVALPCFHLIARTFPDAERVLLTDYPVYAKAPVATAVLGDSGLVHGDMRYTGGTRSIGEILRLAWKIRRFHADMLVYLMPVRSLNDLHRDQLFFRLAGLRRIVGLPSEDELKYRFDPTAGLYESESSRLARSIAILGDAHLEDTGNWDLRLTSAEREAGAIALSDLANRPLIACGPGTKMQVKDWGQNNWRTLLGRLYSKYSSFGLLMIGVKEEIEMCEYAARDWKGAKVNLSGLLSPRESAAALSHASVFVGTDSGPMHLAASVGVPCVCVFSARRLPGIWFPPGARNSVIYHKTECHNCGLYTCIANAKKCILSITVDEMEQAVNRTICPQV
jgi:ADP-heptose:LPS heptosyltransferase